VKKDQTQEKSPLLKGLGGLKGEEGLKRLKKNAWCARGGERVKNGLGQGKSDCWDWGGGGGKKGCEVDRVGGKARGASEKDVHPGGLTQGRAIGVP